jgi:hypothetical protein
LLHVPCHDLESHCSRSRSDGHEVWALRTTTPTIAVIAFTTLPDASLSASATHLFELAHSRDHEHPGESRPPKDVLEAPPAEPSSNLVGSWVCPLALEATAHADNAIAACPDETAPGRSRRRHLPHAVNELVTGGSFRRGSTGLSMAREKLSRRRSDEGRHR